MPVRDFGAQPVAPLQPRGQQALCPQCLGPQIPFQRVPESEVNPRGPFCLRRASAPGALRLLTHVASSTGHLNLIVRRIVCMGFNYSSFLNPYNDIWQEKRKPEPRRQKSCNVLTPAEKVTKRKGFFQNSQLITIIPERK